MIDAAHFRLSQEEIKIVPPFQVASPAPGQTTTTSAAPPRQPPPGAPSLTNGHLTNGIRLGRGGSASGGRLLEDDDDDDDDVGDGRSKKINGLSCGNGRSRRRGPFCASVLQGEKGVSIELGKFVAHVSISGE